LSFLDNGNGYFPSAPPSPTATGFAAGAGSAGIEGPQISLTGGGFKNTISGAFTANRTATVPDVTGIVPVSSYVNSAYDNATRSNGAIGSNWTIEQNGLNIASNQIQGTTAAQSNSGFWNANSFSPVQFAQATITALNGASDFPGVTVLASGTGASSTYYDCVENSTTIFMQRVVNAGTTNLTSTASTGAVGDILRLEIGPGGALTCYKNGAVALTAADSQIASGSPGLLVSGNVATEKNWSGGNLRPLGHLDVEQDWAKPQHFTQGVAFGTGTFTASPRAEQNTFLPGALTATWTGATWTTDKAVTITRVQVQAKTALRAAPPTPSCGSPTEPHPSTSRFPPRSTAAAQFHKTMRRVHRCKYSCKRPQRAVPPAPPTPTSPSSTACNKARGREAARLASKKQRIEAAEKRPPRHGMDVCYTSGRCVKE